MLRVFNRKKSLLTLTSRSLKPFLCHSYRLLCSTPNTDVENKTSLTSPDEIKLFAKLSAQDIVARSKPVALGMVTTIFKYVKAKPHKRYRILADRPAKWHQENKWLANWLYNLFNGKFVHISKPIDDEIIQQRIQKRVKDSISSYFHGRTITRINKSQLSSSSSGSNINQEISEIDIKKIDELYNNLASELNHISLLKVSAILQKHSRRNKNIKGNRSGKMDAIIIDQKFRKELYNHLGVQVPLIYPVLDFLGVNIPEGWKTESNNHYMTAISRRKELEDAIAFVCTNASNWVTDEGVKGLKNSYNVSDSLVVDVKRSHYDAIRDSANKLIVEQPERDRLLRARKGPSRELADKTAYNLEIKKLASKSECIHKVALKFYSYGHDGQINGAIPLTPQEEREAKLKQQLVESRFMPWNYSHGRIKEIEREKNEEDFTYEEGLNYEVEEKQMSTGINGYHDYDHDADNHNDNNDLSEEMFMEHVVKDEEEEISELMEISMQHSTNKIMLGNLPNGITFEEIQDAFSKIAKLEPSDCHIISDRNSLEEQKEALIQLNEQENSILALLHDIGFENEKEANKANKIEKEMKKKEIEKMKMSEKKEGAEDEERGTKIVEHEADSSKVIDRENAKRELKSLRGERKKWLNKAMYLAKSEKSDTIAFLTFHDNESYEKVLREDIRIFGISVNDPITGLSRLARTEDAKNKRELFIEICGGDQPIPGQIRLEHIAQKLQETLGVDFRFYYNYRINHLRPCFLQLQFDTHEEAWAAYEKLEEYRLDRYDDMYNVTNTNIKTNTDTDEKDNNEISQVDDNKDDSRLVLVPHWIPSSRFLLTKKQFQLQRVSEVDRALLAKNAARKPDNRREHEDALETEITSENVILEDALETEITSENVLLEDSPSTKTSTKTIYSLDDTSLGAKINRSIRSSLISSDFSQMDNNNSV